MTNLITKLQTRLAPLKFLPLRLLIGGFFILVGVDKAMSPYQNFMYVVQGYNLFPEMIEEIVARVFPWIELMLGLFLVLGLYLKITTRALLLVVSAFILIIIQALVRKLPIEYCGCFGGLFSSKIQYTLVIDVGLWLILFMMHKCTDKMLPFSLDQYFAKNEK